MKYFQYALWGMIVLLGGFLAYSTMTWNINQSGGSQSQGRADIGGTFEAVLHTGEKITDKDMKGRPHVVFFGFTHCPDVCPMTLYEGSQWYKALGPDGDKIDMYFASIDPERDTAKVLSDYISAFDPRIKGITGSVEQMAEMAKKWRVFAQKVPTDDDYTMNHTATTFLMNSKGEFVRAISYGEDSKIAIQKLKKLIEEDERQS